MGSRARENVEVEELGEYGYGGAEAGADEGIILSWCCPSKTDCLRACGWLDGSVSIRVSGDETRGEVGAICWSMDVYT